MLSKVWCEVELTIICYLYELQTTCNLSLYTQRNYFNGKIKVTFCMDISVLVVHLNTKRMFYKIFLFKENAKQLCEKL